MSIFDMFRSQAPAPAPQTQVTPGNMQPPSVTPTQSPTGEGNGVVPNNEGSAPAESPLDKFKDLWETTPTENSEAPATPQELTQESLQKAMESADFTSGISPEQFAAISQGGEEAQKAFMQAMNNVAKQVMVQATLVNNKLTAKAVAEAREAASKSIPNLLKQQAASNHLKDTNPVFTNPAIKPFIESAQEKLIAKNPNATPAELTAMTQELMTAIADQFSPAPAVNPQAAQEEDWSKFLS